MREGVFNGLHMNSSECVIKGRKVDSIQDTNAFGAIRLGRGIEYRDSVVNSVSESGGVGCSVFYDSIRGSGIVGSVISVSGIEVSGIAVSVVV